MFGKADSILLSGRPNPARGAGPWMRGRLSKAESSTWGHASNGEPRARICFDYAVVCLREAQGRMKLIAWIVFAVTVAVIAAALIVSGRRKAEQGGRDRLHADPYDAGMVATSEGPPVIVLNELQKRGLDEASAELIEPHFHVLNAALVTMVELQEKYDAADSIARRQYNATAIPFHITADLHQRVIIGLLPMPQETIFDHYVQERKRVVGLHDWHVDHTQPTPPGGLVEPLPPRHR
jgi:hypothetical protein